MEFYFIIYPFIIFIEKIRILIRNSLYLIFMGGGGRGVTHCRDRLYFQLSNSTTRDREIVRNRGSKRKFYCYFHRWKRYLEGGWNVLEADRHWIVVPRQCPDAIPKCTTNEDSARAKSLRIEGFESYSVLNIVIRLQRIKRGQRGRRAVRRRARATGIDIGNVSLCFSFSRFFFFLFFIFFFSVFVFFFYLVHTHTFRYNIKTLINFICKHFLT